jgi:nucleotide-binding universal stress UspA family protein
MAHCRRVSSRFVLRSIHRHRLVGLDHIERYDVELLVMGTVAREGIPGLITGNTAERLLPHIPCLVLAVKLEGFTSPTTLDEEFA